MTPLLVGHQQKKKLKEKYIERSKFEYRNYHGWKLFIGVI
jgi:hypothetical protein